MYLWYLMLQLFLPHNVTYAVDLEPVTIYSTKMSYDKDVELLARLIYCEAGNQPYLGKLAVANVVVNRQQLLGTTLHKTIHAKGQFDGINTKYFYQKPNYESYQAAYDVLVNKKRVLPLSVVYFANERISTDKKWIKRVQKNKYMDIYDHSFYHEPVYMRKTV
jgi:N-acetylmuramoyl-L-alanine amidase